MSWTVIATIVSSAVTALAGVTVGGLLARRSQDRQWLRDTKATTYRSLLREYSRIEFDVRRAYLGQIDISAVDWPRWGAAVTEMSLVADDAAAGTAQGLADALVRMDRYIHSGARDDQEWRLLLESLTDAQTAFVNAARRSLDAAQPPLPTRLGGPLIPG